MELNIQLFGGRSSSSGGMGGGGNSAGASGEETPVRGLVSKSQVDELTQDFTPGMFLGDNFNDTYIDTPNYLKSAAERNMPESIDIGGYTFKSMGDVYVTAERNKNIAMLDYQCTEQIGGEFPVLQIGISASRTRSGRVRTEIIRDGYTHKTRFW